MDRSEVCASRLSMSATFGEMRRDGRRTVARMSAREMRSGRAAMRR
jgi:hypothetical protein